MLNPYPFTYGVSQEIAIQNKQNLHTIRESDEREDESFGSFSRAAAGVHCSVKVSDRYHHSVRYEIYKKLLFFALSPNGCAGLGPGALGDTLDIDVTITTQAEFEGDIITAYDAYEHTPGRRFFLRANSETLGTDNSDDAILTLSGGAPNESDLGTTAEEFGVDVTSSNANARMTQGTMRANDGIVLFATTDSTTSGYREMSIYSNEATVLGGTGGDGVDFDDVSLSAGWNAIIHSVRGTEEVYTTATPSRSGAWILFPFN